MTFPRTIRISRDDLGWHVTVFFLDDKNSAFLQSFGPDHKFAIAFAHAAAKEFGAIIKDDRGAP